MTIEWLAGNRLRGTTAERPVGSLASPSVGGWVELGRSTLGGTGTLDVSSLSDKRYYMILVNKPSGAYATSLRLNSDSGTNYSRRYSLNGGSDGTNTGRTAMFGQNFYHGNFNEFNMGYIANISTKEKLGQLFTVSGETAGAGTAPARMNIVSKWTNTSNAINRMTTDGTSLPSGSELVVLGWDPADTHTTNFWEELGSDTGDGASDDLTVSGISAKKYLWIQFYADPDASWTPRMRFNSDTGSNYCDRYNINGGTDGTDLNSTGTYPGFGGGLPQLYNIFMINNSANEKLGISQNVYQGTAGAGNAPERGETALKWSNTSAQITTIAIDALSGTPNLSTKSYLKVWGSD